MATVLFIVTIPTVAEEDRLKSEFIAKNLEQRSDMADPKFATPTPAAVVIPPPAVAPAVTPLAAPIVTLPELLEEESGDATSVIMFDAETTPLTTTKAVSGGGAEEKQPEYATLPKRRKSEPKNKLDDITAAKSQKAAAAGAANVVGAGGLRVGSVSVASGLKDFDSDVNPSLQDAPTHKSVEVLRDTLSVSSASATSKRKAQKKKEPALDLDAPSDAACMELVLREILKKFQVQNAMWTKDSEGRMHQIIFTVEFNELYEKILDKFHDWGIGDRDGSTVAIMNCVATKTSSQPDENESQDEDHGEIIAIKQGAWERFMNSVRSRLNVSQIVRDVRQDAAITFDFLVLLISAAILASFGLVENSTVFLAASMLISPLMGPIIAGIFGTVIKDSQLCALGVKNELFGILMATCVGFVFGIIVCSIDARYGVGEGLTQEMLSRCELHSLLVGVFTAIPSGAAAAIGILGGNTGSLVGVAISASLLPPAVNSGLLWALACIYKFYEADDSRYSNVIKSKLYSEDQATELAILGSISMCLTISNVICVYFMGILVLKVKEVGPPMISRGNTQFWKHDLKLARHLNKHDYNADTAIYDEYANLASEDQKALGIDSDVLRQMRLDEAAYQNTWSPVGMRQNFENSYEPMRDNYSTVHRLDHLYSTITRPTSLDHRYRYSVARRPTTRAGDMGTNYKLLSENLTRCSTMPSKAHHTVTIVTPDDSKRNSYASTPTGSRRRQFIVTPAEDPLLKHSDA